MMQLQAVAAVQMITFQVEKADKHSWLSIYIFYTGKMFDVLYSFHL